MCRSECGVCQGGNVRADVQVRLGGQRSWMTVLTESLAFGSHPIHLQGLRQGNMVAGSLVNLVYSRSWEARRAVVGAAESAAE